MKNQSFRVLASLIEAGFTTGTLASAIESEGICGWDRYGRYKEFPKESANAMEALDTLAEITKREEIPVFKDEIYMEYPGFIAPWDRYGWRTEQLPNLEALSAAGAEAPEQPRRSAKGTNADLALIGALLLVIEGEVGFNKHPDYKGKTEFVELLAQRFTGDHGLGKTTLFGKFKKARQQLG